MTGRGFRARSNVVVDINVVACLLLRSRGLPSPPPLPLDRKLLSLAKPTSQRPALCWPRRGKRESPRTSPSQKTQRPLVLSPIKESLETAQRHPTTHLVLSFQSKLNEPSAESRWSNQSSFDETSAKSRSKVASSKSARCRPRRAGLLRGHARKLPVHWHREMFCASASVSFGSTS